MIVNLWQSDSKPLAYQNNNLRIRVFISHVQM